MTEQVDILGQPVQFPSQEKYSSFNAHHRAWEFSFRFMDVTTSTALDGDVRTTSPVSPNKNDYDASPRIEKQTHQKGGEPKVTKLIWLPLLLQLKYFLTWE